MPTLAELIQERIDVDHASVRGLARETDGVIDHQTIERWRNDAMTQFPRDASVFQAFADILHTSVEEVTLAMAAQLGVPVRQLNSDPPLPGVGELSDKQLSALRALIRSITAPSEEASPILRAASDRESSPPRSAKDRRR